MANLRLVASLPKRHGGVDGKPKVGCIFLHLSHNHEGSIHTVVKPWCTSRGHGVWNPAGIDVFPTEGPLARRERVLGHAVGVVVRLRWRVVQEVGPGVEESASI